MDVDKSKFVLILGASHFELDIEFRDKSKSIR
jgi:hypothetical protein